VLRVQRGAVEQHLRHLHLFTNEFIDERLRTLILTLSSEIRRMNEAIHKPAGALSIG
jgi:RNase P/RNase MRP subunit POP5